MVIGTLEGHARIKYKTPFPLLKAFFDECHMRDLPRVPVWTTGIRA